MTLNTNEYKPHSGTLKALFMTRPLMLSFMLALVLTACTTNPPENQVKLEGTPAQSKLQFVDLQQFDSDLAHSLSKEMPTVEIDFYGKVTPNNLPERLRPWMASLEANGGTVRLASTESTVTTRSPLLLIGVLSSLWSAAKMGADIKSKLDYKKTKGYNATIYIKTAPDGEVVVEKVLLTQQPPVKVP